jgi:hypothetical protein
MRIIASIKKELFASDLLQHVKKELFASDLLASTRGL